MFSIRTTALALLACASLLAAFAPAPARAELEEIVVTATKREASLQEIPIAVTAISADELDRAGVKDLRELKTLSPSFNMNSSQTESQGSTLRMRGVGTTGNNIGLESAVGVFLDGVYLSRPGVALGDLVDVAQLEVLRGPQGTLFGRNTSAGALTIRTRKPLTEGSEGWADFTVGNYSAFNVKVGASGGLAAAKMPAGWRFSAALRTRDGFLTSTVPGVESRNRDRVSLRGQLYFEPSEDVSVRVIADYADAEERCCDAVVIRESEVSPAYAGVGLGDGGVSAFGNAAVESRRSNAEQFENPFEQAGISVEVVADIGPGTLTWIGAYRDFRAESLQHDFVGADVYRVGPAHDDLKTQTHEFRYQGERGKLDWMVGAYYSDESIEERAYFELGEDFGNYIGATLSVLSLNTLQFPMAFGLPDGVDFAGAFADNLYTQDSTSWSLFTHNVFELADNIDFVFGLRWIDEKKDGAFRQLDANSPACHAIAAAALPGLGTPNDASDDMWGALTAAVYGFSCFPFAVDVLPAAHPLAVFLPREFSDTYEDDELAYTIKLAWAARDNLNAYASFTHGYKAGGFNLDATAAVGGADPRFRGETVDAFELGAKGQFWDDRLRLNVALFFQAMNDFQVLEFTGVQFRTFNVDSVESKGFEIEALMSASESLDLSFGVTYADANYPGNCAGLSTEASVLSLCGGDLTNAPRWTGTAGVNWVLAEIAGREYFVNVNARYESSRRTSTQWRIGGADPTAATYNTLRAFDVQKSNVKANVRLGMNATENVSFEIWANNVFDEHTRHVTFNIPLRGASTRSARGAFMDAPRTYGATLRMNW